VENYLERLRLIWGVDSEDSTKALEWIQSCVTREQHEDLYLDFKGKANAVSGQMSRKDKSILAKAVSGFANTDGGLIIWGVDARSEAKGDPDVAKKLLPITGLKTLVTELNGQCGQAVNPPLGQIDNRAVPIPSENDSGNVITVIPRRRQPPSQAASGDDSGHFFLRAGSGFYKIPESILADFYRRAPSPELRVRLNIDWETAKVEEDADYFEKSVRITLPRTGSPARELPWGNCRFTQYLSVGWAAVLENQGLGSAENVVVDCIIDGANDERLEFVNPSNQTGIEGQETCLQVTASHGAAGTLWLPWQYLHPKQTLEFASGRFRIRSDEFKESLENYRVRGLIFARDCPSGTFSLSLDADRSRLSEAFRTMAEPRTRYVPRPESPLDPQHDAQDSEQ